MVWLQVQRELKLGSLISDPTLKPLKSNIKLMQKGKTAVPLTWSTFPPSGKVSKASGKGVLDESRNTEWVVKEKSCPSNKGSMDSL